MMHVWQCTLGWRGATQTSQGGAQKKEDFFQALVSSHPGGLMASTARKRCTTRRRDSARRGAQNLCAGHHDIRPDGTNCRWRWRIEGTRKSLACSSAYFLSCVFPKATTSDNTSISSTAFLIGPAISRLGLNSLPSSLANITFTTPPKGTPCPMILRVFKAL